jgi:hypothetical protein
MLFKEIMAVYCGNHKTINTLSRQNAELNVAGGKYSYNWALKV